MSRSTFNGPVISGVDDATYVEGVYPDSSLNITGPNWGFINMSQSAAITQDTDPTFPTSTTAMGMVIPARSTITMISVLVTTAWDDPMDIGMVFSTTDGVPVVWNRDILVNDLVLTAIGMTVVGPGDTGDLSGTDSIQNWMNVSNNDSPGSGATYAGTDRCIVIDSNGNGSGVGVLTVNYCQAVNLSAIA